jgi:hypothetical protein
MAFEAADPPEPAQSKIPLYTIPVPSTSFTREAYLAANAIRFSYRRDGKPCDDGVQFLRAAALRTRAERCCKAWHIEGVYDTLVEVTNSEWAAEIRRDTQEMWRDKCEMHHYMIYLDSVGCFEFIADSWRPLLEFHQEL